MRPMQLWPWTSFNHVLLYKSFVDMSRPFRRLPGCFGMPHSLNWEGSENLDVSWRFMMFLSLILRIKIRRPGSPCTVFFSYVASKILSQLANPKSPVPQTPKISKIQNPRSPKPKIQSPKSPKSKIPKFQNPNFAHKDLLHNVPKIQNPQNPENPESTIPKIQNPKSPKSPKSKIP